MKHTSSEFSNLLLRTLKINELTHKTLNSVRLVRARINYREPELVRAKQSWYIKYYFRVPDNVKHLFGSMEWKLFRIKGDINRRKGQDKEEYAGLLLSDLSEMLRNGFSPFDGVLEHIEQAKGSAAEAKNLTAREAFKLFLEAWNNKGLDKSSIAKYNKCVTRLANWLLSKYMLDEDICQVTQNHIEQFLSDGKRGGWSNREHNNTFDFVRTCFNYLVKRKIIPESPCAGVGKLKTASTKHKYYDTASLKKVTAALEATDPYCYLAFQTIYYLCVRAEKELMHLKVGNIKWDENKVLIIAGKGNRDRYIPMDNNIKSLFIQHGIDKANPEHYVFGIDGAPAAYHFGPGFFAKRFRKVRKAAGLSPLFTMYSAKHTRIVHLKNDGVPDGDIILLTGHSDFTAYAKYLRDIGADSDATVINKVSRKI